MTEGDKELHTDPAREGMENHGRSGIYVRALGRNGRWMTADIAELSSESLTDWLEEDGENSHRAENCLRVLLGYGPRA